MRSSFTATGLLLLLNVPAFTNGLPHPPITGNYAIRPRTPLVQAAS